MKWLQRLVGLTVGAVALAMVLVGCGGDSSTEPATVTQEKTTEQVAQERTTEVSEEQSTQTVSQAQSTTNEQVAEVDAEIAETNEQTSEQDAPVQTDKERVLDTVAQTDAPSDLVNAIEEVLEVSTNLFKAHYQHSGVVAMEDYFYDDSWSLDSALHISYYRNGNLEYLHILKPNGALHWAADFEQDGTIRSLLNYETPSDLTETDKERVLDTVAQTDAPSDLVNAIEEVLEVSTNLHQSSHPDGEVLQDYILYANGKNSLLVTYYQSGDLKTVRVYDTNNALHEGAEFKQDGSIRRLYERLNRVWRIH